MKTTITRNELLDLMGITRVGLYKMIKGGEFPAADGKHLSQTWDRNLAMEYVHRFHHKVSDSGYERLKNVYDSIAQMDEFSAEDIAGDHHQVRCADIRVMHLFGLIAPSRKETRKQFYRKTNAFFKKTIANPFA